MSDLRPIPDHPDVLLPAFGKLLLKVGLVPNERISQELRAFDERLPPKIARILREVDLDQRADPTRMMNDEPHVPSGDGDDSEWQRWNKERDQRIENDAWEWQRDVFLAITRTKDALQAMLINEEKK